jgi:hypothetical protein
MEDKKTILYITTETIILPDLIVLEKGDYINDE